MAATRRRSNRALVNDEKIRKAVIDEILDKGVDRLSLREVGRRAGLTHGATYARFEDVDEMIIDTWDAVLKSHVFASYQWCQLASVDPVAANVINLFDAMEQATDEFVAGLHVIVASRRQGPLREVIDAFLDEHVRDFDPVSRDYQPRDARVLTVFSVLAGRLLMLHHRVDEEELVKVGGQIIANIFTAHVDESFMHEPVSLPVVLAPRQRDPVRVALSEAAFVVVGRSGVDHATFSRIARVAACPTAWDMYSSKSQLIATALRHDYVDPWMRLVNFVNILEPGYLAKMLHHATNGMDADRRRFSVEVSLALSYHPDIRAAAREHMDELESISVEIDDLSDDERVLLRVLIRIMAYSMFAVAFTESLVRISPWEDLFHVGESIRLGVIAGYEETWVTLRTKLLRYYYSQIR